MRNSLAICLALALLAACGQNAEEKKAVPPPSLITVTQASKGDFEVVLETLGTLEVLADPKVGAEVAEHFEKVVPAQLRVVDLDRVAGDLNAEVFDCDAVHLDAASGFVVRDDVVEIIAIWGTQRGDGPSLHER